MGYLIVDNRESGGKLEEYDTTWCRHCQGIVKLIKVAGMWHVQKCMKCNGPICLSCAEKQECTPFFARVEEWMRKRANLKII